jgi:putative membrane protein
VVTAVPPAQPVRQRLHPLTPLLRGARMLFLVIAGISWQGLANLGFAGWVLTVAVVLLGAVALSAVSWAVTGYQVIGRELRVSEGLLWRRTRAIPLERLQAVDVVRPVLARLAGLAELRLEVIGARRTEAPLAYLAVEDAVRLRERLLALAHHAPVDTAAQRVAPPEPASERLIHAVDNRDVVIGQLLTPHVWLVPVSLVVTLRFADHPTAGFIALASTITALIGIVQLPVRRVLAEWHFRVSADASGLRLRHGLLDTRSQTVPARRVQAVGLLWPLMWRPIGWLHCRIDVAGYGQQADAGMRAGVLLPVADLPTARRVVDEVLDGIDVTRLPLAPPPVRARWLAPLARPVLGIGLTGEVVASRHGWLRRHLVVVPLARIQSVRVVQGPVQRTLRLATVHVDTAGALHALGEHRDVTEAYELAAVLARAARAARRRVSADHQRSASPTAANVNTT